MQAVELKKAYDDAYSILNDGQREAVDTIEGPVMVIAGPGTGKTQILTLRIVKILQTTDTAPENILALTFTESGARAMRERLRRFLGADAYRIAIHTFHSFALSVIQTYPDAYPAIVGGRPATDLERIGIIESILEDTSFKAIRPLGDPSYYVSPILHEISALKREYVTPEGLASIIDTQAVALEAEPKIHERGAHKGKVRGNYQKLEKQLAKNRELLAVYQRYNALLREQRLYDFDDMLIETVAVLESDETVLRDLQETYQYLLADEHQDVNGSQNRILDVLASYHERPNIFVVGDEKQAIYRFQGASLENFLYFEDRFPHTKTIALRENYRSGQLILDASQELIAVSEGPLVDLRVPLNAAGKLAATVEQRAFTHQVVEDAWVCDQVTAALAAGTPADEIAVIVRTNAEVESLANILRAADIPVNASADSDILAHPITVTIEELVRATLAPENETVLARIIHGSYWNIPTDDVLKVLSARSYETKLAALIGDREQLEEIGVTAVDAVLRVHEVLREARQRSATDMPHVVLAQLIEASGLLASLTTTKPSESARIIRRLYDEVEAMVVSAPGVSLVAVSDHLRRLREHNVPLTVPYIATNSEAVAVMTAHKSKGLEFTQVYLPHLSDNTWGGTQHRKLFSVPLPTKRAALEIDPLDDEKRLLYVAMTRAKEKLHVSYSATNIAGKELTPSRLLSFIETSICPLVDVGDYEADFTPTKGMVTPLSDSSFNDSFFATILAERGFSATSFNNYRKSPWNYVYRNVLRIPEVQALPMQFGTVIHSVLERITKQHTDHGNWLSMSEIKAHLERALARLPINEETYVRLHEKGIEALVVYLEHLKANVSCATKEEFSLRVMLPTGIPELPELPLTGNLDRLDFDAKGNVIRVVDYKTGKPKSRNYIEGNTQASDGDYKRQLVFYALLLSLYDDERYQTTTGVLTFVEPDTKGAIKEEVFTITQAEIDTLQAEIIEAVQSITSGSFLEVPCDPKVCDYCDLATVLQKKLD